MCSLALAFLLFVLKGLSCYPGSMICFVNAFLGPSKCFWEWATCSPCSLQGERIPNTPARDHTWQVHRPHHWREITSCSLCDEAPWPLPGTKLPSLVMSSLIPAVEPFTSDGPQQPSFAMPPASNLSRV